MQYWSSSVWASEIYWPPVPTRTIYQMGIVLDEDVLINSFSSSWLPIQLAVNGRKISVYRRFWTGEEDSLDCCFQKCGASLHTCSCSNTILRDDSIVSSWFGMTNFHSRKLLINSYYSICCQSKSTSHKGQVGWTNMGPRIQSHKHMCMIKYWFSQHNENWSRQLGITTLNIVLNHTIRGLGYSLRCGKQMKKKKKKNKKDLKQYN